MFASTSLILRAWKLKLDKKVSPEGFRLFIVQGELGVGKSAYAFKTAVEVLNILYGLPVEECWEKVKSLLVFTPDQFLMKLTGIRERIPLLIWDDAGLWLFALNYKDPVMESVVKMMNTIRTKLASLILTTPVSEMILKRLRVFPGVVEINVVPQISEHYQYWDRLAKGYKKRRMPNGKYYPKLIFEDRFSCLLPDYFYKWYRPIRESYQVIAEELLREEWEKLKKKSKVLKKVEQFISIPQLEDASPLSNIKCSVKR